MFPEWLKALITSLTGAIIGFISAMLMELWKSSRSEVRRAKRIERALYSEMADLYERISGHTTGKKEWTQEDYEISATLLKAIETEAHNFAKANPDVFYTLPNALAVDEIYRGFHLAQSLSTIDAHTVCVFAYEFVAQIHLAVEGHTINIELLKEASPKTYEKIMRDIKADKENHPESSLATVNRTKSQNA